MWTHPTHLPTLLMGIALLACPTAARALEEAAPAASAPTSPTEPSVLADGWRAYQDGQLARATLLYRHAAAAAPQDASIWYDLGCLHAQQEQIAEALTAFRSAVSANPQFAPAHDAIGQLAEAAGHLSEAEAAYARAVELDPEHAAWSRHLARVQLLRDPDAALETLRRLVRLAPADADARYHLGLAWLRHDAPDLALDAFRAAVARNPEHLAAWNGLALAAVRVGETAQAEAALERVMHFE